MASWYRGTELLPTAQETMVGNQGFLGALSKFGAEVEARDRLLAEEARKAEQLKLQQEAGMRAAETLQMQKDDRADKLASREATALFADRIAGATGAGTVGIGDQAKVGETVARIGADTSLTPEQRASKQSEYLRSVLPSMEKAYQGSNQAKLDVIGSVTSGGLVDPQAALAIRREATQPFERMMEQDARAKEQEKLLKMQEGMREAADIRRDAREEKKLLAATTAKSMIEAQKLKEDAYAEYLGTKAQIEGMPQTEDTKKALVELKATYAAVQGGKVPVQALKVAVENFNKRYGKEEERAFDKTKEDKKELDKLRANFVTALDQGMDANDAFGGGLMKDMLENVDSSADKALLEDKYGSTAKMPALIEDIYKKRPQDVPRLSAILNSTIDPDTFLPWNKSKEDLLGEYLKSPEVVESLLGRKPQKARTSILDYQD